MKPPSKYYNEYYTLGALYVDFYRDHKMYLYGIVFLITSKHVKFHAT